MRLWCCPIWPPLALNQATAACCLLSLTTAGRAVSVRAACHGGGQRGVLPLLCLSPWCPASSAAARLRLPLTCAAPLHHPCRSSNPRTDLLLLRCARTVLHCVDVDYCPHLQSSSQAALPLAPTCQPGGPHPGEGCIQRWCPIPAVHPPAQRRSPCACPKPPLPACRSACARCPYSSSPSLRSRIPS